MRQKYLSSWNLINIESKVWRYNRKFQANGQTIDTWTECEKGVQSIGNRSSLERRLVTWYEAKCKNISESKIYRRVRFRTYGTVGYGPTMWVNRRKGADSKACQMIDCQLCWQQRWYQGRGTKRTIFLLVERGGPIGKVLVHRWLPECHQQ